MTEEQLNKETTDSYALYETLISVINKIASDRGLSNFAVMQSVSMLNANLYSQLHSGTVEQAHRHMHTSIDGFFGLTTKAEGYDIRYMGRITEKRKK